MTSAVPTAYTQGITYNLKITFSPTQVVLEGFGAAGDAEHDQYDGHIGNQFRD